MSSTIVSTVRTDCALEHMLQLLPVDALRHTLLRLLPREIARLGRASRRLRALLLQDKAYWQRAYVDDFLGGDHAGTGRGVDEREEIWLARMLALPPYMLVMDRDASHDVDKPLHSVHVTTWFSIYAQRARMEHRWHTATPVWHSMSLLPTSTLDNLASESTVKIMPFKTSSSSLIAAGSRLFWVQGGPGRTVLELTLEDVLTGHKLLPRIQSADPTWQWALAQIEIQHAQRLAGRPSMERFVAAWCIPAQLSETDAERSPLMHVAPYAVFPLQSGDTSFSGHGPWAMFMRLAGRQGSARPMLIHLPSHTVMTGQRMHSSSSALQILTWHGATMAWQSQRHRLASDVHEQPSVTVFSASASRKPDSSGFEWRLTQYQLDGAETLLRQGFVSSDNPVNWRSIWVYRVDHTRAVVRYNAFGADSPVIALVDVSSSRKNDLETPLDFCWQRYCNPEMILPCSGQNMLLIVPRGGPKLVTRALDSGSLVHAIPIRGKGSVAAVFSGRVIWTAEGVAEDEERGLKLIDMRQDIPAIRQLLTLPETLFGPVLYRSIVPGHYPGHSQMCWLQLDAQATVEKLIVADFAG